MTVFIQKYIKNLECIEILYMVQVYILLNILSSNITYGTGTKFSLKLLQLVKKFSSQKKKTFWLMKKQSSGTTAILCLGNPWAFFALAQQRLCV